MPIRHKFERSGPRQPGYGGPDYPPRRPGYPPREPGCPPGKPEHPPEEPGNGYRNHRELPPYVDLAEAYVPPQPYTGKTFDLEAALHKGTIFPDLYRPYKGHFWQTR